MPQGHIDVIRRATDAYNEGDWELLASLTAGDGRMTPLENWPEPGPFVGREEVVREFQRLRENFVGESRITMEEATESEGWVIARYRWTVEGSASGAQVDASLTGTHRVVDGKSAESHFRFDRAKALEAAGLSE